MAEIPEKYYSPLKKRKIVIDSVIKKSKNVAEPVIVCFSNGKPAKIGKLEGKLHQNNSENVRFQDQRLFTVETTWLNYVGKNDDGQSSSNDESVCIGILEKKTGKMKFVEASTFQMNPNVTIKESGVQDPIHEQTYQEKQERIINRFGSKRAKQYMKQRKLYEVNVEGMSNAIQDATTDVSISKEDANMKLPDKSGYYDLLPEFDPEAKTPEEVYKLEWIAPDYFLANFEDIARSYIAEEIKFEEPYSKLMQEIVAISKFESEEENQIRLICLALYAEYLIRFTRLNSHKLKNPNILKDCPRDVKNYIFDHFTGKDRMLSGVEKDRVICHILVIGLIGCKYEVFTNTLIESLHIDLKKLHLLMKAIGATYNSENFCFKLKFPLTKLVSSHKKMAKGIR